MLEEKASSDARRGVSVPAPEAADESLRELRRLRERVGAAVRRLAAAAEVVAAVVVGRRRGAVVAPRVVLEALDRVHEQRQLRLEVPRAAAGVLSYDSGEDVAYDSDDDASTALNSILKALQVHDAAARIERKADAPRHCVLRRRSLPSRKFQ